jgi:hypothetical protein
MKRTLWVGALALAAGMAAGCGAATSGNAGGNAAAAAPAAPAPLPPAQAHTVEAFYQTLPPAAAPRLTEMRAMTLAAYPLSCLDHLQAQPGGSGFFAPYLWQPAGVSHLLPNYAKTRAFYGCYDWHSAVNSTWTLVTLLKQFPNLPVGELIREKLNAHLGKSNIQGELKFYQHAKAFERPYGQAWLLKLYGDLLTWNDPDAKKWAANVAPLAQFFSKNLTSYITTLPTPIRQGVHPNTAFDMDNMLPYTAIAHDAALHQAIVATAMRFYAHDRDCPTAYEPEGVSFLSPCLVEGALMAHILPQTQFVDWFNRFMPAVYSARFRPLVSPFDASKMTKSQMAGQSHLIGLAFSRAAAMLTIADALPPGDPRIAVFRRLAAIHARQGYKTLDEAGYLESHWIASYALMYQRAAARPRPATGTAVAAASQQ